MRNAFLFFCTIFLLSTTTYSQSVLRGDLYESSETFENLDSNISEYQIFKIDVNKDDINISGKQPFLNLDLGGLLYELNLYTDNLNVSFEKENIPLLLGGSTRKGGLVSLTINDDFLFGFIKIGSSKIYIEPLRHFEKSAAKDLFVMYYVSNVIETGEHVCGSDQVKDHTLSEEELVKMPTTSCKIVDYAIANTFDMIAAYGTSTDVMNFNLGVLSDVQTNYRSEFNANLEYDVVAHFVAPAAADNPLSPNTTTNDASILLSRFRAWAQGPGNSGGGNSGGASGEFGVDYTMAGLWTDRDITFNGNSGTVGLAYTPGWHHLLENYGGSAPSLKAMVSHEIGHNWNCFHDSSSDNIMYPSVLLTDNWNTTAQSAINSRVSAQGYLLDCSTIGAPIANFYESSMAVCTGSTIEFEDQSQYGATRVWDFPTGTPSAPTDEKPVITYNTAGLHYTKITSTNSAGSDDFINYVDIQTAPPTICTPSGSGGSIGITSFTLENVSNSSSASGGVYDDYSCSDIVSLETNTSYDFFLGVAGATRLRFFVDYNNDGDFSDSGESSPLYTLAGVTATYTIPITTASSPVTAELLRFRVIVSNATISSNGCTTPSNGEVEDYSFYFGVPQILGCTDPGASNYDPAATVDDGSCIFGSTTWYRDFDNDTYGDPNMTQQSVSQPTGYVANDTDCDDNDATAFPGNPEICDGVDNNCDGNIDEGVLTTWYRDFDNDTYGDPVVTTLACTQPTGYVLDNGDCDDNDALEFPGQVWYKDADTDEFGDGTSLVQCTRPNNYFVAGELASTTDDCDDNDPNAFPGNPEVCDGIDNNCDGNIDEGVLTTYYRDFDNDDFGDINNSIQACSQPAGFILDDTDCDDNDPNAFPGNTEICDGVDNNCDGNIDEGLLTTYFRDMDNDGFGDPNVTIDACTLPSGYVTDNTDCDDNDGDEYPGQIWYRDLDLDLYSNGTTKIQCIRPNNFFLESEIIETSGDCNDNDPDRSPGLPEICNDGIDNNCDGNIDEGCAPPADCDGVDLVIPVASQDEYYAEESITSDATITNGQDILFAAQDEIDLGAGFEVEAGAVFIAEIENCIPTSAGAIDRGMEDFISAVKEELGADNATQFKIYNKWGEVLSAKQNIDLESLQTVFQLETSKLPTGAYIVLFENDAKKYTKTIIVE